MLRKETQASAQRLVQQTEHFLPLVQRVIKQTRTRVLEGKKAPAGEKVLSLFEPHTRAIPLTETLSERIISLPMYPELSTEQRRVVIDAIKKSIICPGAIR